MTSKLKQKVGDWGSETLKGGALAGLGLGYLKLVPMAYNSLIDLIGANSGTLQAKVGVLGSEGLEVLAQATVLAVGAKSLIYAYKKVSSFIDSEGTPAE